MHWRLHAVYLPVHEMNRTLTFYRDQVGLQEAWREDNLAIAFLLPATDAQLIIGRVTGESPAVAGPVFVIPSVDKFYMREQGKIEFVGEPVDIPPGRLATAKDPSGNCLYFLDVSTASS